MRNCDDNIERTRAGRVFVWGSSARSSTTLASWTRPLAEKTPPAKPPVNTRWNHNDERRFPNEATTQLPGRLAMRPQNIFEHDTAWLWPQRMRLHGRRQHRQGNGLSYISSKEKMVLWLGCL